MKFGNLTKIAGVVLATFMSASGGPYLVLMMQGFVASWERVLGKIQGRWDRTFSLFAAAYVAIDLFSTRTPFHVFVTYFTFSKQSAYNRILIFEYGTAEGPAPDFRDRAGGMGTPAVDVGQHGQLLAATAVRYGLPALLFLLACCSVSSGPWANGKTYPRLARPPRLGLHPVRDHRRRGQWFTSGTPCSFCSSCWDPAPGF